MNDRSTGFKVGIFVIVATVLMVASILIIAGEALFDASILLETYLDESAEGLVVGSRVKYRGVEVGRVVDVGFVRQVYGLDKPPYVRVVFSVRLDAFGSRSVTDAVEDAREQGLKFRKVTELVSGNAWLEADYENAPDPKPIEVSWNPEHLYVASAKSLGTQIQNAAEQLFQRINRLEVEAIVSDLHHTILDIGKAVGEGNLIDLVGDLRATAAVARQTLESVEEATPVMLDRLDGVLGETEALVKVLRSSLESGKVAGVLDAVTSAGNEVAAAADSVARLARKGESTTSTLDQALLEQRRALLDLVTNLRLLTSHLESILAEAEGQPSRLFLGDPPPPSRPREEQRK
jgi:hypothetical protein